MENTYHSRSWLRPPNSLSTHTCSYIFCHYGTRFDGSQDNFIKIADCDKIIGFYFGRSKSSIKVITKFIDHVVSVINGSKSKVSFYRSKVKITIKLDSARSDETLFSQFTIEKKYKQIKTRNEEITIHCDPETCDEEEFVYKLNVIKEELIKFKEFLERLKHDKPTKKSS